MVLTLRMIADPKPGSFCSPPHCENDVVSEDESRFVRIRFLLRHTWPPPSWPDAVSPGKFPDVDDAAAQMARCCPRARSAHATVLALLLLLTPLPGAGQGHRAE